jgi:hypothetical protein
MTSVLQPIDVSINKAFKDRLRQQYLTLIADPARELTETGKIKRASPSEVTWWGMESHPREHYRQIFQEVLHNNALDGSKDDILWEDDGE